MKIFSYAVLQALLICTPVAARELPFRVTIQITDDEGQFVSDAKTGVTYERENTGKPSERFNSIEMFTDNIGQTTLEGKTAESTIAYGAEKHGHYQVRGLRHSFGGAGWRRWEPWNPIIEIVLRRIKNPVPMFAKREERKIPGFGKPFGYDLVMGDWVAPYGKGAVSDFLFEAARNVKSPQEYDGTLTLRFTNDDDGLLPLEIPQTDLTGLRMPYSAPEEGYISTIRWQESRHTAEDGSIKLISSASKTMNYFIRVRTVRDAEGKIVRALYGKMHGDIRWFIGTQAPKSGLAFTYYLNPDGTRNVEFDPKRNLLKSSKPYDSDYENLAP